MNLLHSSSSAGNLGVSSCKVNMESYANQHITSDMSRISHSLNHLNIGPWIVDSGLSDHIYSSIKFFDTYKKIILVNIRLPNGHRAMERYLGTIAFSPGFIAQDVFFVPEFNMNLLSIPKPCFDHNL